MAVLESPLTGGFGVLVIVWLLVMSRAGIATAQASTDPTEVKALNAILGRWGLSANLQYWNFSGEPCSGLAIDDTLTNIDQKSDFNPGIKCDCTYNSSKICHIITLKVFRSSVTGPIPAELQNLTYLTNLNMGGNYLTGSIPAFLGNLTRMQYLSFGPNALSGSLPKELGNLQNLISLGLGTNNFSGSIPNEFGNLTKLEQLYITSAGLSGELPTTLSKLKNMRILWASDNDFIGKFPDYIGAWTNLRDLQFQGNSFQGPIPSSLSNLVNLTSLRIGDITNGTSSTLDFVSNMTSLSTLILRNCKISDTLPDFSKFQSLQLLDLSFNNITGQVPQSIFSLNSLAYLFLGNNSLSGSLPSSLQSTSLKSIDLSYNLLSGSFPSWISQNGNLQLNLVANNFVIRSSNSSIFSYGLECLQRDIPCNKGSPRYSSFAINCGGDKSVTVQDGTEYQSDNVKLSASSYYVTGSNRWGVSNVGTFVDASDNNYIIGSISPFQNTLYSALFQTSRMSPSSLRYYGFGLENGNYTVKLQFGEMGYPDTTDWTSVGRRVFDIYIQGALKDKDFDIRKSAGGRSFVAIARNYTVPVTNNFLEIHFFWAGKGTCCIPNSGYYGPAISAISVSPNFKPTVSNKEPGSSKSKTSLIASVLGGVAILVFITIVAILYYRHKKKKSEIDEELFGIADRANVFNYVELRTATEAFSASHVLGEGGYGPVYKGKLSDGRIVAVKKLGVTSHQGKREFLTEISTISAVQHKNLVKLYGCCIEGNNRLLVYEFLENGSLDQALFGKRILYLDWATRFDICLSVARGLAYLHEESSVKIVHRDIKASNILLDSDLNPKISDFGLARLYEDNKTHISTRVAGTIGYLAPEYAMRGHLTEKTDVFAFGVVVLEVVAGRSNTDPTLTPDQIYLLERAWSLYEQNRAIEVLDPKLASYDEDQALKLITISLLCTQRSQQRPSMSRIVAMLTGDLEVRKVDSKPSYLTDWQFKEMTENSFSAGESSETITQSSGNGGVYSGTSHSYSTDVLMDSIIQDGR